MRPPIHQHSFLSLTSLTRQHHLRSFGLLLVDFHLGYHFIISSFHLHYIKDSFFIQNSRPRQKCRGPGLQSTPISLHFHCQPIGQISLSRSHPVAAGHGSVRPCAMYSSVLGRFRSSAHTVTQIWPTPRVQSPTWIATSSYT